MANVAYTLQMRAAGMQAEIDRRRAPRLTNTRKRVQEAESQLHQAERLEKVQSILSRLGQLHEHDSAPPALAGIRSRAAVQDLVDLAQWPTSPYSEASRKRLLAEGLTEATYADARRVALSMVDSPSSDEVRRREIERMERELVVQRIPGFFPTPRPVVERMLELAEIGPGMTVLEPSAGAGAMADVIRERHSDADLAVMEWSPTLRSILEAKGYNLLAEHDFLAWPPESLEPYAVRYDRILMNPPFERAQDIDHVRHAYDLLAPGGRLVAVMSWGSYQRQDRKTSDFRDWLEGLDRSHEMKPLPLDAFKPSGTSVSTGLVVIDRPAAVQAQSAEDGAPISAGQQDHEQLSLIPVRVPEFTELTVPLDEVARMPDLGGLEPDRSFLESIARFGVIEPVVLQRLGAGEYRIVDGRRRVRAAVKAGLTNIRALVTDAEEVSGEALTLLLNEQRKPNPAAELAAVERLLGQGYTLDQIGEATGLHQNQVQRLLRLGALTPELRQAFDHGDLSRTVAERLARLPSSVQEQLFVQFQRQRKLTREDVAQVRRVQVQAAVQALPASIFGTGETSGRPDIPKIPGASLVMAPHPDHGDDEFAEEVKHQERQRIAGWLRSFAQEQGSAVVAARLRDAANVVERGTYELGAVAS